MKTMSKSKIAKPEVHFTKDEKKALTDSLDSLAISFAEQRRALIQERSAVNQEYEEAKDAELARCGIDLEKAFARLNDEKRKSYEKRYEKKRKELAKKKKPSTKTEKGPAQWVNGIPWGVENTPFDLVYTNKWEQGNVIGDPYANNGASSSLEAFHSTQFGPQIEAYSIAALGFFYVPNSAGTLTIWLGGSRQHLPAWFGGAAFGLSTRRSAASGYASISLGIQRVDRNTFQPDVWLSIMNQPTIDFDIYGNASYQAGAGIHQPGPGNSIYLTTIAQVDDLHTYFCWAWVFAHVYTIGNAGSEVWATLSTFNFPYTLR